jgi:hypothetical protein
MLYVCACRRREDSRQRAFVRPDGALAELGELQRIVDLRVSVRSVSVSALESKLPPRAHDLGARPHFPVGFSMDFVTERIFSKCFRSVPTSSLHGGYMVDITRSVRPYRTRTPQ